MLEGITIFYGVIDFYSPLLSLFKLVIILDDIRNTILCNTSNSTCNSFTTSRDSFSTLLKQRRREFLHFYAKIFFIYLIMYSWAFFYDFLRKNVSNVRFYDHLLFMMVKVMWPSRSTWTAPASTRGELASSPQILDECDHYHLQWYLAYNYILSNLLYKNTHQHFYWIKINKITFEKSDCWKL